MKGFLAYPAVVSESTLCDEIHTLPVETNLLSKVMILVEINFQLLVHTTHNLFVLYLKG